MFLSAESYSTRAEYDSVTGFMADGLSRSQVVTIGLVVSHRKTSEFSAGYTDLLYPML
jgi:hypothetical protein